MDICRVSSLTCFPYTQDCILNALRCDVEGIKMESEILDSTKNTTEAKFQHYQIYKQIHAESTLLRAFLVLCGKLAFTVLALVFVPVELNDLDLGWRRNLLDNLLFNTTLL